MLIPTDRSSLATTRAHASTRHSSPMAPNPIGAGKVTESSTHRTGSRFSRRPVTGPGQRHVLIDLHSQIP